LRQAEWAIEKESQVKVSEIKRTCRERILVFITTPYF